MTHGKTYEEAVKQGIDTIEGWIQVARDFRKTNSQTKGRCMMLIDR